MKRVLVVGLWVLGAAACSGSGSGTDGGSGTDAGGGGDAGTFAVSVGANGALAFAPTTANIHVGDTVTWTFAGAGHTVTSGAGCTADNQFCSPNDTNCANATTGNAGTTYSHTFTDAGTFPYFCQVHCAAPFNMKGTVVVSP